MNHKDINMISIKQVQVTVDRFLNPTRREVNVIATVETDTKLSDEFEFRTKAGLCCVCVCWGEGKGRDC